MKSTIRPSIDFDFLRFSLLALTILLFLSILGCQEPQGANSNESPASDQLKPLQNNDTGKNLEKMKTFRGLFIYGHEVRSFTPCDSKQELWGIDKTDGKIIAAHQRLTHEPYQAIFVDVRGMEIEKLTDGFGADYDGAIIIKELVHASSVQESWGCREKYGEFIFKAQGNEPGWTVFVTRDEIRFSSINHEKPIVFPYSSPTESGTQTVYKSSTGKSGIKITLERTSCSDTMSDELFGWKATVNLDETKYEGCAKKGDQ